MVLCSKVSLQRGGKLTQNTSASRRFAPPPWIPAGALTYITDQKNQFLTGLEIVVL